MLRTFVGFLAVLGLASTLLSQTTPSRPAVQPDNPHRLRPPTDQELHLAYWTLEPGWHTEIEIRNNTSEKTIAVTPVLRTAAGAEVSLPNVSLSPDQVTRVDLTQAVAAAAPELLGRADSYGSVVLRYSAWAAQNILASAMLHRLGQPISFHFDAASPKWWDAGSTWESVWWLPTDSTDSFLLLSNAASEATVAFTTLTDPGGAAHSFPTSLGPYQTARIDLRAAVARAGFAENYGGVQVRFEGRAGQAIQLSYDEQVGFSKLMKVFYRRPQAATPERITTRAPMVALTRPDPVLLFPSETRLQAQVLVRNASAADLPVTVSVNWRSADTWSTAVVPFPPLKPAETRILDLSALQEQGVIPSSAAWATVNLSYSGQRGDLVPIAASHAGGRYMVQSPFSDATTFQWKGSEWTADPLHNSLITAGNGGSTPAKVAFYLYTKDGKTRYELPERTLAPGEQMWVDVGQLIRSQAPDRKGKVLPVETQSGSYEIVDLDPTDEEPGRLYEGKLVIDKTRGHVTYGCAWPCCTCDAWIELNPVSVGSGFQFQETGYKTTCCNPTPVVTNFVNWFSFNTSIATVSGGLIYGLTLGTTTVSAGNNFYVDTGGSCTKEYITDQAPVAVLQVSQSPQSLSMSSGDTDRSISVTVSGGSGNLAFSVGATANPNSSSQATVTIPGNSNASGTASYTISASGANSPSGIFGATACVTGVCASQGTTINIPPQVLIQVLHGEAHGQAVAGDSVSQPAVGSSIKNRFGKPEFPGGSTATYQAVIVPSQYVGISTTITTGIQPELGNAVNLFTGVEADSVAGSPCFFSPTASGWSAIYAALQSGTTTVPSVANDPLCYSTSVPGRQIVYKSSIGNNVNGNGAPAFIFERQKSADSNPAVVQIP